MSTFGRKEYLLYGETKVYKGYVFAGDTGWRVYFNRLCSKPACRWCGWSVVYYGLKLYTGTAGFIRRQGDWTMLVTVLLGNIVGCLLSAWMIAYAQPDCIEPAAKIMAGRVAKGPWACFLLAIGCGFIMTTAVEFARKGKMLPLVLGVPVFILCGFAHSIADAFYFLVSPAEQVLNGSVLAVYLSEVLGNFVGCNLYRWTTICIPKE